MHHHTYTVSHQCVRGDLAVMPFRTLRQVQPVELWRVTAALHEQLDSLQSIRDMMILEAGIAIWICALARNCYLRGEFISVCLLSLLGLFLFLCYVVGTYGPAYIVALQQKIDTLYAEIAVTLEETAAIKAESAELRAALAIAALSANQPFGNEDVCKHIFSFIGAGDFYFVATVCREFQLRCLQQDLHVMNELTRQQLSLDGTKHCHCRCTQYGAVFVSEGRLRLAHAGGKLDLSSPLVQLQAGKHASKAVLLVAHELGLPLTAAAVLEGALQSKDLSKVVWLHTEQACPLPANADCTAATAGDVAVLSWLQQQAAVVFTVRTGTAAAAAGHSAALQVLHDAGCPLDVSACTAAAKRGDSDMFKWLNSKGVRWQTNVAAVYAAAGSGNVQLLIWVRQHVADIMQQFILHDLAMTSAVLNGKLDMCKYLQSEGCPVSTSSAAAAAAVNRLDILQWMCSAGAVLTADVMKCAALGAHLNICKYLHTQQCPWDATVCSADYETAKWLIDSGCPWQYTQAGQTAALSGSTKLLELLQERGAVWTTAELTSMLRTAGASKMLVQQALFTFILVHYL
jgi:hypothetical protein